MKRIFILLYLIFVVGCSNSNSTINVHPFPVPEDYPSKQAELNGDIIVGPPGQKNIERMEQFIENHTYGKYDKIRITSYTDEGDPILQDLETDGETINYIRDNTRDAFGGDKGIKKTACTNILKEDNLEYTIYIIEGCKKRIGTYDSTSNRDIVLSASK